MRRFSRPRHALVQLDRKRAPRSPALARRRLLAIAAIVDSLAGRTPGVPALLNICYSLINPDYGISITDVYRATAQGIAAVPNSGGVSPLRASATDRKLEADYTQAWYRAITADSFG